MHWVLVNMFETSKHLCTVQCTCALCELIRDTEQAACGGDDVQNWPTAVLNYEYFAGELIEVRTDLFRAGVRPLDLRIGDTMRCMLSAWFRTCVQVSQFMLDVKSPTVLEAAREGQTAVNLSRRTSSWTTLGGGVGTLWRVSHSHTSERVQKNPCIGEQRVFEDGQTKYRRGKFFMIIKNWVTLTFKLGPHRENVHLLMNKGTQDENYPEEGVNELTVETGEAPDPREWRVEMKQANGYDMFLERTINVFSMSQDAHHRLSDGFEFFDVRCYTSECLWELDDRFPTGKPQFDEVASVCERYARWPPSLLGLRCGQKGHNCTVNPKKKKTFEQSLIQRAQQVLSRGQLLAITTLFPPEHAHSILGFFKTKAEGWGILGSSTQRSECDAWFDSIFLGYDVAVGTLVDAAVDFTLSIMRFHIAGANGELQGSAERLCQSHAQLSQR